MVKLGNHLKIVELDSQGEDFVDITRTLQTNIG